MAATGTRKRVIGKTKSSALPTQIVCLGASLHLVPQSDRDTAGPIVQRYWMEPTEIRASRWRWDHRERRRYSERVAPTAADFWAWLGATLRSGGVTWLFVFRAGDVLPALGLWELLDAGELYLHGHDPQAAGGCNCGADRTGPSAEAHTPTCPAAGPGWVDTSWDGYLVCESPPWIMTAKMRGRGGVLHVIDLGNYGFAPPPREADAAARLAAAESAVESYRRLLVRGDFGAWQNTVGSQSMHAYRRHWMNHRIVTNHCEQILDLEGAAYYGGRCECYRIGTVHGPAYYLDVNAMYPSVMLNELMPTEFTMADDGLSVDDLRMLLDAQLCIARVDLETDTPLYPYRTGHDVIYPVGRYTTTLCGPELGLALARSDVRKVHDCACYHGEPCFHEWVSELWGLRRALESDGERTILPVLKSLMVSLAGKFGQRDRRWIHEPAIANDHRWDAWYEPDPAGGDPIQWRCMAGQVYRQEIGGWARLACPAIAAWITSLARVQLWRLMSLCGREHVYYCDTDGIWTDAAGLARCRNAGTIGPREIGLCKIDQESRDLEIRGVKHYVADQRILCAGVPADAVCYSSGRPTVLEREPVVGALQQRRRPEAKVLKRVATWRREYKHGRVQRDGSVLPHVLREW